MKNFIVDGMDRCGKTTLINNLTKLLNPHIPVITTYYPKLHWPEDKDNIEQTIKTYNTTLYDTSYASFSYMNNILMQVIMDRSHISEYVYGQLYRNYDSKYAMKAEQTMDFANFACRTTLIVLVDNPEGIIYRDDGKSNSIHYNDLLKEKKLFLEAFKLSTIKKKIFINIFDKTIDDVYNLVKRHQMAQFNQNGDIF